MRVLYCAHGIAGIQILPLLLKKVGQNPGNILSFTYQNEENTRLIDMLGRVGVKCVTDGILDPRSMEQVKSFRPQLVVSIHYRDLVPNVILMESELGGINLHPSLLPKYRGAFSAPWAIINGEKETGITYHFMTNQFDRGNIVLQSRVSIDRDETGLSLFHKLIELGKENFNKAFNEVVTHGYQGKPQEGTSSYYPREVPFQGLIDTTWTDDQIDRFIRAMTFPPKPYARLVINGAEKSIKTWEDYKKYFYG